MGAVAGPVAGRFDSAMTRTLVECGITGGGNAIGNITGNLVAGEDYSVLEGLIDAGAAPLCRESRAPCGRIARCALRGRSCEPAAGLRR